MRIDMLPHQGYTKSTRNTNIKASFKSFPVEIPVQKMGDASLDEKHTMPLFLGASISDIHSGFQLGFFPVGSHLEENSPIGTKNMQYVLCASSKSQKLKELPSFLHSDKESFMSFMKESESFFTSSLHHISGEEKKPISDAPPRTLLLKPARLQKLVSSYMNIAKGGHVAIDNALVHEIRKRLRRKDVPAQDHGSADNPSGLAQAESQRQLQKGFLQSFASGSTLSCSRNKIDECKNAQRGGFSGLGLLIGRSEEDHGCLKSSLGISATLKMPTLRMKAANLKGSFLLNHSCIGRKKRDSGSASTIDYAFGFEKKWIGMQHSKDGIKTVSPSATRESGSYLEAHDISIEYEQSSPVSVLDDSTLEEEISVDVKDIRSSLKELQIQLELLKFCHWSAARDDQLAAKIAPVGTSELLEDSQSKERVRRPCSSADCLGSAPFESGAYGMHANNYHHDLVPVSQDAQLAAKISEIVDKLNSHHSRMGLSGDADVLENHGWLVDDILCPKDKEVELHYVKDLLVASGFMSGSTVGLRKWHAPNQPIDPLVYKMLEDTHCGRNKDDGLQTRGALDIPSKRLLFDRVNEILVELLDPCVKHKRRWLSSAPCGKDLLIAVWVRVNEPSCIQSGSQDSLNALVSNESKKMTSWSVCSSQVEEVGLQLERAIFDDLIEDTLLIF